MWIEIISTGPYMAITGSCPAWGMWIEISPGSMPPKRTMSCPAWGMWIEMFRDFNVFSFVVVMPRMGHVD